MTKTRTGQPKPERPERQRVTLILPSELVRAAKHYAVDVDEDLQDIVAQALRAFLATKKSR